MPFDDPMLPSQWHYNNDGSIPGTVAGADANVFKGWEIETGKKDVLVAIVDGGFQVDHPDLAQNVYVNEAEKNGKPGVDDDGNGYTDDVYGYNFVINSADVNAHSHGTHVAGTVGAVNGNGLGVAGVAGGSGEGGVKCWFAKSSMNAPAHRWVATRLQPLCMLPIWAPALLSVRGVGPKMATTNRLCSTL